MPDVPEIDKVMEHRIERSDRFFKLSVIGAIVTLILVLVLILVQNQINANAAVENAARNHKRTQEYVKCIAQALTVQISQRVDLDQCTQTVDKETKAVN